MTADKRRDEPRDKHKLRDKRSDSVTIGTHRLGIRLWITLGRRGDNVWSSRARRLAVPSRVASITSPDTPLVDPKTPAGLAERASSPVSTVPMTTTIYRSIQQQAENPRPIGVPPRSFSAVSEVPDSQLPDSEGRTTETQRITQNLEAANSEVPC